MNKGEILGFATQYPVLEGRIAIDTAVRILEQKQLHQVRPDYSVDDRASRISAKINMSLVLAPADFKADYSVKAP